MKDNMARSIASDKRDPNNFPEDSGLRLCTECAEDIKVDLMNAKEAEVEEYSNCYSHLKTVEELQEYAFEKVREITGLKAEYEKYFAIKDKRIFELETKITHLESQVRYRDGHIEELQAHLAASKQIFDDCTRIAADCLERNKV